MNSLIYTSYSGTALLAVNDPLPLGSAVHRYGCNVRMDGGAIRLRGSGYYKITASATIAPTAAGEAGIQINLNGLPVEGGLANVVTTAAAQEADVNVFAVVRVPCCEMATVTMNLTGSGSTVTNVTTIVEKM